VKPAAAEKKHQGTPTDGWEGQVIKGKGPKESKKEEKREEAAETIMSMEEKEHGIKDPKKLVQAEKKEHAKDKKISKSEGEEKLGAGASVELVKAEMKRMLAEEAQSGDAPDMSKEESRADKKEPEALKL